MCLSCSLKFEEADNGSGTDATLLEPSSELQSGEKDLGAVYLVPHFVVVFIHPIAVLSALSHLLLKTRIKPSCSICCVSFSQSLSHEHMYTLFFCLCLSVCLSVSVSLCLSLSICLFLSLFSLSCMFYKRLFAFYILSLLYLNSMLQCTG